MNPLLVTGANGQVGRSFRELYPDAFFVGRKELDLSSSSAIQKFFMKHGRFQTIINLAAYTQVDVAEKERELCFQVNATAPKLLAENCESFFHISTDYVFDGTKTTPYTEDDSPEPINYYGETKFRGEIEARGANSNTKIFRTSWVYSKYQGNFLTKMLELAKTKKELNVVYDQVGSPTLAVDLASVVFEAYRKNLSPGIYNYSNEGTCSWYDFAKSIFNLTRTDMRLKPILSKEYPTLAERPKFSVLDKTKIKNALGLEIPHWQDSLERCIQSL